MPDRLIAAVLGALAVTTALPAAAQVTASQAQALRGALTPVGAERAGNLAGTIPPWTGGIAAASAGAQKADVQKAGAKESDAEESDVKEAGRADLFPGEAKRFSITAGNAARYADQLPAGALALFRAMPDFRMDIYPTHRTAAFPQRIYDNIFANATRAHPAPEGIAYGVAGASGGIPFPIPANGAEIVWNHLLAFWGTAREAQVATYVCAADGSIEQSAAYREITDFPYYDPKATPQTVGAYYFKTLRVQQAPAARAESAYIAWQPLDTAADHYVAWRVLPGEHRVRKAPSLSYDTPDADAEGMEALDEYYLYFGGPDRYDWRILGKREMYVPYNNNRMYGHAMTQAIGKHHENPDELRYELHRVWVVEGTLAAGKHDVVARRRLYIDEDSWLAVYEDEWDEDGKLWKFGHATMYVLPDIPTIIIGTQFIYDLQLGGYVTDFVLQGAHPHYKVTALHDPSVFSAQSLAANSDR